MWPRDTVFKPITFTWYAKSRSTKSIPGLYSPNLQRKSLSTFQSRTELTGYSCYALSVISFYGYIFFLPNKQFFQYFQKWNDEMDEIKVPSASFFETWLFISFQTFIFSRVSVQGVKSLGGHSKCLCFDLSYFRSKKILFFKKKRKILQKEQNSTNLLLWTQSAGINVQSPQSESTPRRLTLFHFSFIQTSFILTSSIGNWDLYKPLYSFFLQQNYNPSMLCVYGADLSAYICMCSFFFQYFQNEMDEIKVHLQVSSKPGYLPISFQKLGSI